jgi:hypothetical protein
MAATVATIVSIIAAAVAIGVFLGKYAKETLKRQLWKNITTADRKRYSAAAVNIVVIAYETLFGGQIGSRSFFIRSVIAYASLLVVGAFFLALKFPSVFFIVASPYMVGTPSEAIATAILTASGGLLFWAANAQTLYFLRLARSDPRPTPIILIFYADALLTASICVFGIGFLFSLLTIAHLDSGERQLTIEIRTLPAEQSLRWDIQRAKDLGAAGQATFVGDALERQLHVKGATAILIRNIPSDAARRLARRDLDLVTETYPESGLSIQRYSDDAVQFLSPSGEVESFHSISQALNTDWDRYFEDEVDRAALCKQMLSPAMGREPSYMKLRDVRYLDGWGMAECLSGKVGRLTATASLNRSNISYGDLLTVDTQLVFQHLVSAVTTGFRTFAQVHPLSYLIPAESGSVWRHMHVISEGDRGGLIDIDRQLLYSYLAESGVGNAVLNRSLPGGLLITAIFATSTFTVLLLIAGLLATALSSGAIAISNLGGHFNIEKYPFVFVLLTAGTLVSVFYLIVL